ncbi:Peroxide stress-activated histidine kinase mak1 [Coniochaeta hoffmannii]|uniref:histidine kinase n=1 Tax=Coniochaeta hoffmannii TaxID=91930 RepID=A0AA38W3U2_9PEZI|nr:Peroxide stress-activated histidine kinase mak1 [Coniochaeta hoffmannii]
MDKPDAERQLSQYRERLAHDIARREMSSRSSQQSGTGRSRVSPIQEETAVTSPPETSSSSEPTTASTESGHTIRGGVTPGLTARTPSYPFPRMVPPSFAAQSGLHHPFTTLSPTTFPRNTQQPQPTSWEGLRIHEKVLSNPSTPASNMTFMPAGYARSDDGPHDFPSPNLYDLSLMLSAEPGLEAWWNAVVQIMTEAYKAERVTLAIPADSTDVENVPWGQKATYNVHWEDEMSMGYMARGSSLVPSSTATEELVETPTLAEDLLKPSRPGIQSRHSFTAYEDKKERGGGGDRLSTPSRPAQLSRSVTSHPGTSLAQEGGYDFGLHLNKQALEEHDAIDGGEKLPSWETPFGGQRRGRGKMLNVLQALDYEADPLIDHNGVMRVLERGKVIALTRNYPYLDQTGTENVNPSDSKINVRKQAPEGSTKKVRRTRTSSTSKVSSAIGGTKAPLSSRTSKHPGLERRKTTGMAARIEDDPPRPATPNYEEFEQAPPSPWSQSPAPSPAVRQEVSENPFFTDAMVDEETFNPSPAPPDYSSIRPPEAIGLDNSWTVLHIPLIHPLLSKPNAAFKLDSTLMDQKSSARARAGRGDTGWEAPLLSPEPAPKQKHVPIAILSILSPIIPYPSNLRYSLEHLAPHLATSFSMCRHYTNLEIEVNGLQKRRPQNAGFGAIGHDGRPLIDPTAFANMGYLPTEDTRGSMAGSITSPSDYSGVSRSGGASGGGTPMWEPSAVGFAMDLRPSASSPAPVGDSYFNTKPKSGTAGQGSRRNSKESSSADKRSSLRLSSGKSQPAESGLISPGVLDTAGAGDVTGRSSDELSVSSLKSVKSPLRHGSAKEVREREQQGPGAQSNLAAPTGKQSVATTPGSHRHTQLHSYGADFASTFQSLPPSSIIGGKGPQQPQPPTRMSSISTVQTEMTPPSDRLKGLILDSLPAHVFVALPQTGEIVWVNSRFLTYRGKTSADLASDPWGSLHPDDRDDYLRAWAHSVRTGEQFSRTVRIRRFDGQYRWFYARAVASKDKRGVILQFLGSYMDIHDQHIAELRAARQEEIEASEAKHRLLANLIPQIIFTATEDEGITFANEQWLSYTGQSFEDSLGLGFMDHVHPDDLAKCRVPTDKPPTPRPRDESKSHKYTTSAGKFNASLSGQTPSSPDANLRGVHVALSRNNSSSSSSMYELPTANLTELARKGVIKVATDSNGRLSYTTEIRLRSKFGDYRWHLVRCVEIDNIDFGNGASSYFGSATDINDHKLLEEKLKEAMDSKGRFLSNMSHEIRTPLIGISGMVSFLQDTTLNEEQRDYTNTIQTSANSLLMIINDILDLSKVDAGMMKLNHEWFHTRSLIEDVNELVSTMAIAKRLELNYVVEEDVPAWIKGDRVRIRQVLLNVIGNAIKFTNQGEVFSRCKVVNREGLGLNDDEIMLEFSIIDTGRGFTKEEAELIFKPFSQIDGSSTRQHGGSGLGLVISRQLVELHGGKMEGSAIPGKGSTFTFTAKFGLPTNADGPEAQLSPRLSGAPKAAPLQDPMAQASKQNLMANKILERTPTESPQTDTSFISPPLGSSGSSQPSISSTRTHLTDRSSMSSVNVGLVRFSEAARASGQDLSQMKLDITMGKNSPGLTPTPNNEPATINEYRPPMYSILVISPQTHSREATTRHIEMTLPKDVAHQITALATVEDAQKLIGGDDPVIFTHIVVNLPSPDEIISLMDQIRKSSMVGKARILILSDSVQRQAVLKQVAGTPYEELLSEKAVTYIYKPVKPSRFAVIFDPAKERDLSIDRNRSTAQKIVENQKQSYLEAEKRMGHKGYKVLLVEDNPVNQKVLQKYLKKVGVEVEIAMDGVECTEKVFSQNHNYYSLILCDLHMPRKDGYQACREIRAWEKSKHFDPMPIIALSANVMSDVQEKCVAAGFNDYVTKPVDFIELSTALSKFF